ncbi:hypothetical protein TWF481_003614 [Arthrobotrys musiformis]|uniref:Uncharacterized protein n=1 Tax=Arthrobotrys musiformis TaxID=47236 RepID=A0AAV9WH52_9PEZI
MGGAWDLYSEIFSELSPENQGFLSEEITDHEIDEVVRLKAPQLPSLVAAKISVSGLSTTLISSTSTSLEGSTFYYVPLTRAPGLLLQVETVVGASKLRDKLELEPETEHGCTSPTVVATTTPEKHREKQQSAPRFVHRFSSVIELQLLNSGLPTKEQIDSLSKTFPNLELLKISQHKQSDRDTLSHWSEYDREHRYDGVGKLRNLSDISLPWPAYEPGGAISPSVLSEWIQRWVKDEARRLDVVSFDGIRYILSDRGRSIYRENIVVTAQVDRDRGELVMHGDTSGLNYKALVT